MRMDKLTTKFQAALADAQSVAVGRDNQYIEPVHLMAALLDQQGGTARPLLEKAGVNVPKLRSELSAALDRLPTVQGVGGDVLIGNDLNKLLNVTDKLAQKRSDQFISSELFVLAACDDRGELGRILKLRAHRVPPSRRRSRRFAAARRWRTPAPRRIDKRSRNTASISRKERCRASSIR